MLITPYGRALHVECAVSLVLPGGHTRLHTALSMIGWVTLLGYLSSGKGEGWGACYRPKPLFIRDVLVS